MPKVLIVEDDPAVRDVVSRSLSREGMEVEAVGDGEAALERFRDSGPFDLAVLDISLPGMDGFTLCGELRRSSKLPIIMLTARDDETSIVVGLEVGADDYVTKPFSPRQLASRVRANLRRRRMDREDSDQEVIEFPGLTLDLTRQRIKAEKKDVDLTAREFEVLEILASHPGRVYSRDQIMDHLWNGDFFGDARAADVHIQHIRQKIEPDPKNPRYVRTVRGRGYKFMAT